MDNQGYRIKYKDKWMEIIRILGRYDFKLHDDYSEINVLTKKAAMAGISLVCEDNEGINIDDIQLVAFTEQVKPRTTNVRKYIEKYL